MRSRELGAVATIMALALVGGCQDPPTPDSGAGAAESQPPPGYTVRLDRSNRDPSDFQVRVSGESVSIETGPTGILYNEANAAPSGDYRVSATFTEVAAPPGHREGSGLFIGGNDLEGANQRYTYFLVRADGRFLIKTRAGSTTHEVTDGWVESGAIATAGQGDVVNRLTVAVAGDLVRFECNGTELASLPSVQVESHGVTGLRVNHNLTVQVTEFAIER